MRRFTTAEYSGGWYVRARACRALTASGRHRQERLVADGSTFSFNAGDERRHFPTRSAALRKSEVTSVRDLFHSSSLSHPRPVTRELLLSCSWDELSFARGVCRGSVVPSAMTRIEYLRGSPSVSNAEDLDGLPYGRLVDRVPVNPMTSVRERGDEVVPESPPVRAVRPSTARRFPEGRGLRPAPRTCDHSDDEAAVVILQSSRRRLLLSVLLVRRRRP